MRGLAYYEAKLEALREIMAAVEKTRRVVVVDECHHSCGVSAELAASIWEAGYDKLKAPLRRVATLDVPVPYNQRLEEFISPSESRIIEAIRGVMG
jgi:pyruvate dehydrogenase E1 component beta subunit